MGNPFRGFSAPNSEKEAATAREARSAASSSAGELMGKRTKTPEQLDADRVVQRAQDLAAVGMQGEAAELANQADVEITRAGQKREGQKVSADSARRLDAFAALKESMRREPYVGCFDAARRFERDLMLRRREGDAARSAERVDCDGQDAPLWFIRVVEAGIRIDAIKAALPRRDWWLLVELITPSQERPTWRSSVAYVTGEENYNAQGAAVRAACVNLRDAYETLDVGSKKAA